MTVTLKQLELLNAIVVAGSISKAMRLVGLSQPTISQQLARLEEELGTQLVLRGRSSTIELTPAGQYWYQVSEDMLRRMREVSAFHEGNFREDRMTLRLGLPPAMRGPFLVAAARLALEQNRFARFDCVAGINSADLMQQMQLHQINCAVVSEPAVAEHRRALHVAPLFRDKLVWAVPASVPEAVVAETLAARALSDPRHPALARYVESGASVPWRGLASAWYRTRLPFATPFFGTPDLQAAVELVAAGLATSHVILSQLPNLPRELRAGLRLYDIRESETPVVFAMPRHLLTLRPFAQFRDDLCAHVARVFRPEMFTDPLLPLPQGTHRPEPVPQMLAPALPGMPQPEPVRQEG